MKNYTFYMPEGACRLSVCLFDISKVLSAN